MGRLRAAVHTLSALDLPPDELLARLADLAIHQLAGENLRRFGSAAQGLRGGNLLLGRWTVAKDAAG